MSPATSGVESIAKSFAYAASSRHAATGSETARTRRVERVMTAGRASDGPTTAMMGFQDVAIGTCPVFTTSSSTLDRAAIGTAVLVLVAVVGLRLVRALVVLVEDAVVIVVGVGAAVLILEAILVLRIVRTQIVDVEDAV